MINTTPPTAARFVAQALERLQDNLSREELCLILTQAAAYPELQQSLVDANIAAIDVSIETDFKYKIHKALTRALLPKEEVAHEIPDDELARSVARFIKDVSNELTQYRKAQQTDAARREWIEQVVRSYQKNLRQFLLALGEKERVVFESEIPVAVERARALLSYELDHQYHPVSLQAVAEKALTRVTARALHKTQQALYVSSQVETPFSIKQTVEKKPNKTQSPQSGSVLLPQDFDAQRVGTLDIDPHYPLTGVSEELSIPRAVPEQHDDILDVFDQKTPPLQELLRSYQQPQTNTLMDAIQSVPAPPSALIDEYALVTSINWRINSIIQALPRQTITPSVGIIGRTDPKNTVLNVARQARAGTVFSSSIDPTVAPALLRPSGVVGGAEINERLLQLKVAISLEELLKPNSELFNALPEHIQNNPRFQRAINKAQERIALLKFGYIHLDSSILHVDPELTSYILLAQAGAQGLPGNPQDAVGALETLSDALDTSITKSGVFLQTLTPSGKHIEESRLSFLSRLFVARQYAERPRDFLSSYTFIVLQDGTLMLLPVVAEASVGYSAPSNLTRVTVTSSARSMGGGLALFSKAFAPFAKLFRLQGIGLFKGGAIKLLGGAVGVVFTAVSALAGGLSLFQNFINKAFALGGSSPGKKQDDLPLIVSLVAIVPVLLILFLTMFHEGFRGSAIVNEIGGGNYTELPIPPYDGPLPAAAYISGCPVSSGIITQCPYQPSGTHEGVDAYDIAVRTGTQVFASHTGIVVRYVDSYDINERTLTPDYGNYVMLLGVNDQGERYYTIYAHLATVSNEAKRSFETKQPISIGTLIGLSDNNGYSTGPHLHYEYKGSGRLVLPLGCGGYNGNQCQQ